MFELLSNPFPNLCNLSPVVLPLLLQIPRGNARSCDFCSLIFVLFLQSKENVIKKQYYETVKVQEKQYKAWRNHALETVPRKEQKDVGF